MRARILALSSVLLLLTLPAAAQQQGYDQSDESTAVEQAGSADSTTAQPTGEAESNAMDQTGEAESNAMDETGEASMGDDVAADEEQSADEELPQTASPLALLALLGLASAGSAAGVRHLRRKQTRS